MKLLQSIARLLYLAMLILLIPLCAAAEETATKDTAYRRVYAPANRLADWPRGRDIYKPIDAEMFERWASGAAIQQQVPQIRDIFFSAKLADQDQLTGEVEVRIESPQSGVSVLPLGPCEIALTDLYWEQVSCERSRCFRHFLGSYICGSHAEVHTCRCANRAKRIVRDNIDEMCLSQVGYL